MESEAFLAADNAIPLIEEDGEVNHTPKGPMGGIPDAGRDPDDSPAGDVDCACYFDAWRPKYYAENPHLTYV